VPPRATAWRRQVVALAFLAAIIPARSFAQSSPTAAPPVDTAASGAQVAAPSFKAFGRGLLLTFGPSLFRAESLPPFAVGMLGTGAVSIFDQEISDHFRDSWPPLGDAGQVAGGGVVIGATAVGLAVVSAYTDSPRFKQMAFAFGQGIVLETVVVQGVKFATGRERPDGSDNYSFPSGHAGSTFTLATVVSHYYGWKLGVPLFTFAGLVSASRVEKGKHWASDVVAGATIGIVCGQAGIRTTARLAGKGSKASFLIQPYVGPHGVGVMVDVRRGTS
jgi:membrane-associated phospholipid phosphatase